MIVASKLIVDDYKDNVPIGLYTIPVKRWKILTAKFLTILTSAIVVALSMLVLSIVFGWLFFGWDSLGVPYLLWTDSGIVSIPIIVAGLFFSLLNIFSLIFCTSLVILLGLVLKNSLISSVVSVSFYFVGTFLSLTIMDKYGWLKWLPFANMDFRYYFDNSFSFPNFMSPMFSFFVLMIYLIPILIFSYVIHSKQDIK